ncbi:hypothetical protein psageK4_022c [Pseudomonas phage psageK4]|uniref:Uncharacterized protein n=5 Tax=Otagovirus TaxID=2560197 RepID=A0A7G9V1L5_9CAUD|nr:hypothetical protein QGX14_gp022 [Pseudomonas phage psageK4]YP_010766931.1 hypothetical protein QGX15_gp026 [Pseudomonas phage psageK4e]YP_010767111.1 hypothetical protein QGX16_gp021 [Pseudomonas phage phiPsa397]YP_010767458.1 hypothetical protein QGX18_gp022 [Pseudomonas phage phiPsa347]YP_010767805.1 hypothetical protein QGX20_gp019 [Pseudomonas phage phiPsa300]QNO00171.1 hypothetical protein phiPsa300_019 [Pseudomonas phage phiPsa300]QNO00517.1 hypothetical protein phiPsa347_022 [Pseud
MKPEEIRDKFMLGVEMLEESDKAYMLDKIEEARWKSGPYYNRGVHILFDMVQLAVEASYASPNRRIK